MLFDVICSYFFKHYVEFDLSHNMGTPNQAGDGEEGDEDHHQLRIPWGQGHGNGGKWQPKWLHLANDICGLMWQSCCSKISYDSWIFVLQVYILILYDLYDLLSDL